MERTLEERISAELDTLWQAALFLSGGGSDRAERLLQDMVSVVSDEYPGALQLDDGSDGLERFFVRRFFQDAPPFLLGSDRSSTRGSIGDMGSDVQALLGDAGRIPPRARAALWLVVIRRRSYADGSEILGIDRAELHALLEHRETLLASLVGRSTQRLTDIERRIRSSEESAS